LLGGLLLALPECSDDEPDPGDRVGPNPTLPEPAQYLIQPMHAGRHLLPHACGNLGNPDRDESGAIVQQSADFDNGIGVNVFRQVSHGLHLGQKGRLVFRFAFGPTLASQAMSADRQQHPVKTAGIRMSPKNLVREISAVTPCCPAAW
jgi:hypothetical protein